MGLMGPWAITKSMVKLRLHSLVGARLAHPPMVSYSRVRLLGG